MLARWLCVGLSGCNWFYGLDDTRAVDAAERPVDAPPDREDEDLDGVPNDDDNCPGIPNPAVSGVQPDGDGDGVGNLCDRDPVVGVDRIAASFMFNNPTIDRTKWGGEWRFLDGFVDQPLPDKNASMFTIDTPVGTHVLVEARMRSLAWNTIDSNNRIGIVVEGVVGSICYVTAQANNTSLIVATAADSGTQQLAPIPEGVPFTMRALLSRTGPSGPTLRCIAGTVEISKPSPVTLPDSVGIVTQLDAARVDYVVIYTADLP